MGESMKSKYFQIILTKVLKTLIVIALLLSTSAFTAENDSNQIVRIGVLAKRGSERCIAQWGPTADYLAKAIPGYTFSIVPLDFDEVSPTVEHCEVDFILVNSALYIAIEHCYGARRIATLVNLRFGTAFAGVIFTRKDNTDIEQLADLRGKSFMAVDKKSFGGWHMAWRKFKESGINPYRDFAPLRFGGTHDAVVYAVRDGKVNAGSVRSDTLERMASEGKISINDFRILDIHQDIDKLPFLHSTQHYPEWPFAKIKSTSDELAKKVAVGLFMMAPDCPAAQAAKCQGWTIPANYKAVRECLQTIQVYPFEDYGKVSLIQAIGQHPIYSWVVLGLMLVVVIFGIYALRSRKKIAVTVKALQLNEMKFRTLYESSSDAIMLFDKEVFFDCNSATLKMFGCADTEEFCSNAPADLSPPNQPGGNDSMSLAGKRIETARKEGSHRFEWVHRRIGGGDFPAEVLLNAMDLDGRLVLQAVVRDISDRKEAEKELKISKEFAENILETANTLVVTLNPNACITTFNRYAEELTGYKKSEVLNKNWFDLFIPARDKKTMPKVFEKILSEMLETSQHENHIVIKNGKERLISWNNSVLRDNAGNVNGSLGIGMDISERKKAEEKLNLSLEQAKAATKAKSAFLASMSHEIRTPLNGVLGMAELLSDTTLNDEQKDFVKVICSSGDSLLSILNDILDYSKIESGKMEMESISFDLYQIIEEVLDMFRSKQKNDLELIYYIDKDVPQYISSDSTRIKQLLINLIGNAFKFTEKGDIVLNVSKKLNSDDNKQELLFSVTDTGIGIPADKIKHLFEVFSQVDSSTTRKYGGTGLGLALCQRIVKMMGGEIWVESESNTGSKFLFNIFVAPGHDCMTDTHCGVRRIPELEKSYAILVDDNSTNLKILSSQCAKWGLEFETFLSASEALISLKSGKFYDIGIIDMEMPEMTGVEFACEVRKFKSESELPLILISSSFSRRELGKGAEFFASILLKPAKQSELYTTIHDILSTTVPESKQKDRSESVPIDLNMDVDKSKIKVFMAEDNPINQKLGTKIFEKLEIEIKIAENGAELLEILNINQNVELDKALSEQIIKNMAGVIVFMDCQMPEMDGYEATSIIRKWEDKVNSAVDEEAENIHIRIIALTANALQGDREVCINAGMDDYISKPLKFNDIKNAFKTWK
jgi:PAS domain S-box-containing protein